MLSSLFDPFVKKSPVSVMIRGLLERVLSPEKLDEWYDRTVDKQYTRNLLFSSVYDLLSQVVFNIKPSVHAAYQEKEEDIGASVVAVYDKLKRMEAQTSAELVRYSATEFSAIINELGGRREDWLPGYRIRILDGNCIESTEHRIKELREVNAGALPGKSLVVFDPALGMAIDVFPCEDGHAQERSLLKVVLQTVEAGDVWIDDRNFCVNHFLCETDDKKAWHPSFLCLHFFER